MRNLLFILLVLVVFLPGCSLRTINPKEARGSCLAYNADHNKVSGGSCGQELFICDTFMPLDSMGQMTRSECLAHCDAVKTELTLPFMTNGCWNQVQYAWGVCSQTCRGKAKADPAGEAASGD